MKRDWPNIIFTSTYLAIIEIKKAFKENELNEVKLGLVELINAMARNERRALLSQLARLMMHIIKWKIQPHKRSLSWVLTILNARREIEDIREEMPSLTRKHIESIWDKSFNRAIVDIKAETGIQTVAVEKLSWEDVFKKEYKLPLNENLSI